MDNIKDDKYYLKKIISDMEFAFKHTKGLSEAEFNENEVLQDSMMFRLIQISENSIRLTEAFRESNKTIPWSAVRGMRNRIVHDYGNADLSCFTRSQMP
ncbi:MAG: DUF86 domain-containing protein [Saccharofermentanales bacterium]|jgi:uncharacterized protein with HEPN domain